MNTLTPIRVVVTGGAGFIGSHLTAALLAEGYAVTVVDNFSSGKRENIPHGAVCIELDVNETTALTQALAGTQYVFHLAAIPQVPFSIEHPIETHKVNVDGTLSVLKAAQDARVQRVVYSSSSAVYGDQVTLPLTEDMLAQPQSPYGLQKYIGELYCCLSSKIYGLETLSLRYFNVYGPGASTEGAYASVLSKCIDQRAQGLPLLITGDGLQTRDFVHVRDVVRANILAARAERVGGGEVINIGSGHAVSVARIAELVGGPVEYVPQRLEPRDSCADVSRARELLEWKPEVSLEDGVAELKKLSHL